MYGTFRTAFMMTRPRTDRRGTIGREVMPTS